MDMHEKVESYLKSVPGEYRDKCERCGGSSRARICWTCTQYLLQPGTAQFKSFAVSMDESQASGPPMGSVESYPTIGPLAGIMIIILVTGLFWLGTGIALGVWFAR